MHKHSSIIKARNVRMVDKDGNPLEQTRNLTPLQFYSQFCNSPQSNIDNLIQSISTSNLNDNNDVSSENVVQDSDLKEVDKLVSDVLSI